MADAPTGRPQRKIAFLTHGLNETDLAKSIQALDAAGIHADVIAPSAAPALVDQGNDQPPPLTLDRVSPSDYSALALPSPPEQTGVMAANEAVLELVQSMQAAGKPILYIPIPNAPPTAAREPDLPVFNFKKLWVASWKNWNDIDAPRLGAALAYYTLLSLAPLLVLIVSVAGIFFRRPLIQSGLLWQMRNLMGDFGVTMIKPVLESTKATTGLIAGVLSVLTLLVGASGVFLELRDSLDVVWGVKPHYGSGLWSLVRARLFAFLMVLLTGFLLAISIAMSAILATPVRFFLSFLPNSRFAAGCLGAFFSVIAMSVVFALIFKIIPDIHIGWGDVWIGALATSVLFNLGKLLIGVYLATAGVGSAYAAAGSLIVFLTWVYYSVQIFLLGAEFTHEYALRHGSYSQGAHRARRFWWPLRRAAQ